MQKTAYEMRISDWSSDVCSSDLWEHIRRIYFRDKLSLHQIAKRTGLSRNTIRKWVRAPEATQPAYQRCATFNKLSPFHETLEQALKADSFRPRHNRRSAKADRKSTRLNSSH